MEAETVEVVIIRVQSIEADIAALRRTVEAERLLASDRQYLARCFDLLDMELGVLREYLGGVVSP